MRLTRGGVSRRSGSLGLGIPVGEDSRRSVDPLVVDALETTSEAAVETALVEREIVEHFLRILQERERK